MKRFLLAAAVTAMAVPAVASAIGDYQLPPTNSACAACKAERAKMGDAAFKLTCGTNKNRSNAFGKCMSNHTKTEKANQASAGKAGKAEQADPNFAAAQGQLGLSLAGTSGPRAIRARAGVISWFRAP